MIRPVYFGTKPKLNPLPPWQVTARSWVTIPISDFPSTDSFNSMLLEYDKVDALTHLLGSAFLAKRSSTIQPIAPVNDIATLYQVERKTVLAALTALRGVGLIQMGKNITTAVLPSAGDAAADNKIRSFVFGFIRVCDLPPKAEFDALFAKDKTKTQAFYHLMKSWIETNALLKAGYKMPMTTEISKKYGVNYDLATYIMDYFAKNNWLSRSGNKKLQIPYDEMPRKRIPDDYPEERSFCGDKIPIAHFQPSKLPSMLVSEEPPKWRKAYILLKYLVEKNQAEWGGKMLPASTELSSLWCMSYHPITEAMKALELEGLGDTRHAHGFRVREALESPIEIRRRSPYWEAYERTIQYLNQRYPTLKIGEYVPANSEIAENLGLTSDRVLETYHFLALQGYLSKVDGYKSADERTCWVLAKMLPVIDEPLTSMDISTQAKFALEKEVDPIGRGVSEKVVRASRKRRRASAPA